MRKILILRKLKAASGLGLRQPLLTEQGRTELVIQALAAGTTVSAATYTSLFSDLCVLQELRIEMRKGEGYARGQQEAEG
jgi:hypothetical protein